MAIRTATSIKAAKAPRRKIAKTTDPDADAFSVAEFCRKHTISLQTFYKFIDEMPDTFTIGTRRLISREAAARWRAEREAASAAGTLPAKEADKAKAKAKPETATA